MTEYKLHLIWFHPYQGNIYQLFRVKQFRRLKSRMNRLQFLILFLLFLQLIQLAEPKKGSKALATCLAKIKLRKKTTRCFNILKGQQKQSRSFKKLGRQIKKDGQSRQLKTREGFRKQRMARGGKGVLQSKRRGKCARRKTQGCGRQV